MSFVILRKCKFKKTLNMNEHKAHLNAVLEGYGKEFTGDIISEHHFSIGKYQLENGVEEIWILNDENKQIILCKDMNQANAIVNMFTKGI